MRSPFKFLDYFEKKDRASFFGREAEKERLYKLVTHHRLSLIYGPSGTGKTSLIRCGLANRLKVTAWLPIFVKRQQNINESLISVLKGRLREKQAILADSSDPVELLEALNIQYLRPPYLIFDQLEELYIDGSPEERAQFTNQIKSIIDAGLSCRIIFVLREEYLGRLYEFEQVVPIYYEQRLRVEPLTAPVVKEEVIQKSFALFNISLAEAGLADRMLENLSGLKQVIPLPYLQVYLDRLWNAAYREQVGEDVIEKPALSVTPAIVEELGTLEDVFASYLMDQRREIQHSLAERFPACPEDFVRSLLDGLVTPEGTKRSVGIEREGTAFVVQAPVPTGWDKVDSLLLNEGLQALAAARLLRVEEESVELAHDSLAAVIDGQRSAEERQLNLYRQQIRASFEMFPQTGDYLSKNKVPLYEENLSALALPVKQQGYLWESKTYWAKINEAELEQVRLVAEEKLGTEREKRHRSVLFSLVTGVMALIALVTMTWALNEQKNAVTLSNISKKNERRAQESEKQAIMSEESARASNEAAIKSKRRANESEENLKIKYEQLQEEKNKTLLLSIESNKQKERALRVLDHIYFYQDAYGLAKKDGLFGFIDKELNVKIPFIYKKLSEFNELGFAIGRKHDLGPRSFIDTSGNNFSIYSNIDYGDEAFDSHLGGYYWKDTVTLPKSIKVLFIRSGKKMYQIGAAGENPSDINLRKYYPPNRLNTFWVDHVVVKNFSTLTDLQYIHAPFSKLYDMSSFKKLTYANLSGSRMPGIESLSNLEHLKYLDISYCGIENLSPISKMKNIEDLNILNNRIVDLSPLKNSLKLKSLRLNYDENLDYNDLSKLVNIKELEIEGDYFNDKKLNLSFLKDIERLRSLSIVEVNIDSFTIISNFSTLEDLTLRDCGLTSIKGLGMCKKIKYLNLSGNPIDSLEGISALSELEVLVIEKLDSIQVNNINGKKHLSELSILDSLGPGVVFKDLDNLKSLDLGFAHLNSVMQIIALTNLEELHMLGTPKDFEAIKSLKHIKKLTLHLEPQHVSTLKELPNLKTILVPLGTDPNLVDSVSAINPNWNIIPIQL